FSSRRRHTRFSRDWSSDVCSSDLKRNDYTIYCLDYHRLYSTSVICVGSKPKRGRPFIRFFGRKQLDGGSTYKRFLGKRYLDFDNFINRIQLRNKYLRSFERLFIQPVGSN